MLRKPCDEGGGAPVTVRRGVHQALAPWSPAVASDHVRGSTGLVQEDEALRVHVALPDAPVAAVLGHVDPILLGRPQLLFLCVWSSRLSIDQIVISDTGATPRSISAARISARVIPFRLAVSSRRNFSCPASSGLR